MLELEMDLLTENHLGKHVKLVTPYEEIAGVLTDFYGSFDENEAVVIVEINDEAYSCNGEEQLFLL